MFHLCSLYVSSVLPDKEKPVLPIGNDVMQQTRKPRTRNAGLSVHHVCVRVCVINLMESIKFVKLR
jgi:hypothetical protein